MRASVGVADRPGVLRWFGRLMAVVRQRTFWSSTTPGVTGRERFVVVDCEGFVPRSSHGHWTATKAFLPAAPPEEPLQPDQHAVGGDAGGDQAHHAADDARTGLADQAVDTLGQQQTY